ncbi:hypothetical protein GGI35DRAFT_388420 [Trichoderma velutinum]
MAAARRRSLARYMKQSTLSHRAKSWSKSALSGAPEPPVKPISSTAHVPPGFPPKGPQPTSRAKREKKNSPQPAPYRRSGGQLQQFPLLIIRRQQPARSCLDQSRLVCGGLFQLSSPGFPTRSSLSWASLSFSHSHTHSRNARLAFATKPPPLNPILEPVCRRCFSRPKIEGFNDGCSRNTPSTQSIVPADKSASHSITLTTPTPVKSNSIVIPLF